MRQNKKGIRRKAPTKSSKAQVEQTQCQGKIRREVIRRKGTSVFGDSNYYTIVNEYATRVAIRWYQIYR